MSYTATVYKVMIASPGDVNAERGIVRETLAEWNAIHSEKSTAVLLPVGWETHSSPGMGGSPQSIINRTVLKDCDLLVGIFWTRVGTPTKDYPSGSVEEIEKHIAEGKPTMLYFSSAPVVPDSVDANQYAELKKFRESCKSRGLLESYSDLQDFRTKFSRHIQLKLNQEPYFKLVAQEDISYSQPPPSTLRLSNEGQELLRSAAASADGHLLHMKYIGGEHIEAGDKSFIEPNSARSAAAWVGGLNELLSAGFIKDVGWKGEVFKITREGYKFYDLYLKG